MASTTSRSATVWLFLLVSVLTVAMYLPGLSGDYAFDDLPNLLENKRLHIKTLDLDALQSAAWSSGAGVLRRPVSMASFALNYYFFGIAPYSYKVANLVIHLLTGFGLFLFTRLLLKSYGLSHRADLPEKAAVWLPLVVSGLWLVHPLNLTSALYIVQRMTSLATLFMVYGMCLYVAGRIRMIQQKHGLPLILTGLLVFGGLALFSKESGVLLPLYMLLAEVALFRFRNNSGNLDRTIVAYFLAIVGLPAILLLSYIAMHPSVILGGYAGRDFTLSERLFTEMRVLVFYLKMIIAPTISELGLYHDDIALSHGLLDPPTTLYSLFALAGLLLGGLLLLKQRPLIGLGILWFFVGHTLESTVYPLEIAHEHRNYLADYGILLAAGAAIAQAPLHRMATAIRTVTPLLFFVLFASTTWLRASQWSDNVNQAVYEARHHPNSVRAVFAAGRVHGRLATQGHHDSEEKAYAFLERAARLDQASIIADVTLIKLSYLLNRPVKNAWFEAILHKLASKPLTASDIQSLQELASCVGNICDIPPEKMEPIFALALKHQNAIMLSIYGYYTINKRGNFPKGLALFKRAVERSPREAQLWINLIKLLVVMQRADEAEENLRLFMATDTHGGSVMDYRTLQKSIDELRKTQPPLSQISRSGDG